MNENESKHREIADEMLPIQPDFQIKQVKCYNIDCMAFMKTIPDNFYELAIVDPPYGIGIIGQFKNSNKDGTKSMFKLTKGIIEKEWDSNIPEKEYFDELFRISKHQIIWGGNYFLDYLHNTKCMIVWDKMNGTNNMADCELAWTSFNSAVRKFKMHHFSYGYEKKIHLTQKPKLLYQWLLTNYAKDGDKIFDSHGGSFSSACACLDMRYEIDICEIDKEYFTNAVERLKNNVQDYFEFA